MTISHQKQDLRDIKVNTENALEVPLSKASRRYHALMCQKSIWAWACHHHLQIIVKCLESAARGPCNGPITHNITQPTYDACYLCRLHHVHWKLKVHFKHIDWAIFRGPWALPNMGTPFLENNLDMDDIPQLSDLDNDEESSDPIFCAKALQLWKDEKNAKRTLSYKGRYGELEEFRTDAQRQRFEDGLWPLDPVEPNQYMEYNHVGPPPCRTEME
ncbi:MAG: hypothetical protein OHK93_002669 [Ramalina farinacea]|uniref:Uncharacterized protein n=1 Tax=Ramalina farinacea TaxID=258253 RepID=A0AA43TYZ6_9LECA|nr:hypothetical protein [Ramalina farinacea]